MPYNKARAEKEWLAWKTAEEAKLRELGVDEETIQRLHTYDWIEFNRERRYLQRWAEWPAEQGLSFTEQTELLVHDPESLLDSIEKDKLLTILRCTERRTLAALLLKMEGFSEREIASRTGLSANAISLRLNRLRKKLKKNLE